MAATPQFRQLARTYAQTDIEFNNLKAVTLAQWILESARGASGLAREHNNFGGIKWRPEMQGFATPVEYEANDGLDTYCAFDDLVAYIDGYWQFLTRRPYEGWRDFADSPADFIAFIGGIWAPSNPAYAERVLNLVAEARTLLRGEDADAPLPPDEPGTSNPVRKPEIAGFYPTRNKTARNGTRIARIILHYTAGSTAQSAVNTFQNQASQVSAHYIIGRNGDIFQMMEDYEKAWHTRGANDDSIGIEHVALPGQHLTAPQEASSVALIRWLLSAYRLSPDDITGHRFAAGYTGGTPCPANLFGDATYEAMEAWISRWFRS